ncbi:hypothetical protein Bhyg_06354 [Pseudolycoriella hygida]|uniref:Uncharacterized protein n=1 Tax=Pseudolycoriella hygida TaxID=35572 RepID=A0A9Q0S2V3_9DIPT|nr:hypothetical protein Bhyg_06354 [Pseudolycoriella hygida]
MPLSQPSAYQSNWEPDEIILQEISTRGLHKNKYSVDGYGIRTQDVDNFDGANYGSGKRYEAQPFVRSVNGKKNFAPLCRTVRKTKRIRNDLRSEYRPEIIEEYLCAHPYKEDGTYNQLDNRVCIVYMYNVYASRPI